MDAQNKIVISSLGQKRLFHSFIAYFQLTVSLKVQYVTACEQITADMVSIYNVEEISTEAN